MQMLDIIETGCDMVKGDLEQPVFCCCPLPNSSEGLIFFRELQYIHYTICNRLQLVNGTRRIKNRGTHS